MTDCNVYDNDGDSYFERCVSNGVTYSAKCSGKNKVTYYCSSSGSCAESSASCEGACAMNMTRPVCLPVTTTSTTTTTTLSNTLSLLSPSDGAAVSSKPSLDWTDMSSAWYHLYYKKTTDTSWSVKSSLTESKYTFTEALTAGTYQWNVRACTATACTDSATWTFTVGTTTTLGIAIEGPAAPTSADSIRLFAASDSSVGLDKIVIYVDDDGNPNNAYEIRKTCQLSGEKTGTCQYDREAYPANTRVGFYAIAYDKSGSMKVSETKSFTVSGTGCTDSDVTSQYPDGKNYYVNGTCKASDGYGYTDYCSYDTGRAGVLKEAYCSGNCKLEDHTCASGEICRAARCIQGVPSDPVCMDSDDGSNAYIKGKVDALGRSGEDSCYVSRYQDKADGTLIDICSSNNAENIWSGYCGVYEYYCSDADHDSNKFILCPNGCKDGACVKDTANIAKCEGSTDENAYLKGSSIKVTYTDNSQKTFTDGCCTSGGSGALGMCHYYCEGNSYYFTKVTPCESGKVCSDGACVSDAVIKTPTKTLPAPYQFKGGIILVYGEGVGTLEQNPGDKYCVDQLRPYVSAIRKDTEIGESEKAIYNLILIGLNRNDLSTQLADAGKTAKIISTTDWDSHYSTGYITQIIYNAFASGRDALLIEGKTQTDVMKACMDVVAGVAPTQIVAQELSAKVPVTVTISGTDYTVELIGTTSSTTAVVNVNGVQDSITRGATRTINGLQIRLEAVFQFSTTDQTQTMVKVTLSQGTNTVTGETEANTQILSAKVPITVTVSGIEYSVKLVGTPSSTTAVINVNGVQDTLSNGETKTINGLQIKLIEAYQFSSTDQTQNQAKIKWLGGQTETKSSLLIESDIGDFKYGYTQTNLANPGLSVNSAHYFKDNLMYVGQVDKYDDENEPANIIEGLMSEKMIKIGENNVFMPITNTRLYMWKHDDLILYVSSDKDFGETPTAILDAYLAKYPSDIAVDEASVLVIARDIGDLKFLGAEPVGEGISSSLAMYYSENNGDYSTVVVQFSSQAGLNEFVQDKILSKYENLKEKNLNGNKMYAIEPTSGPTSGARALFWSSGTTLIMLGLQNYETTSESDLIRAYLAKYPSDNSLVINPPETKTSDTFAEGESRTVTVNGISYNAKLVSVNANNVNVEVGSSSASLKEKESAEVGGIIVYAKNIYYSGIGGQNSAELLFAPTQVQEKPLPTDKTTSEDLLSMKYQLDSLEQAFTAIKSEISGLLDYYRAVKDINNINKYTKISQMVDNSLAKIAEVKALINSNIDDADAIKDELENSMNEIKDSIIDIYLILNSESV